MMIKRNSFKLFFLATALIAAGCNPADQNVVRDGSDLENPPLEQALEDSLEEGVVLVPKGENIVSVEMGKTAGSSAKLTQGSKANSRASSRINKDTLKSSRSALKAVGASSSGKADKSAEKSIDGSKSGTSNTSSSLQSSQGVQSVSGSSASVPMSAKSIKSVDQIKTGRKYRKAKALSMVDRINNQTEILKIERKDLEVVTDNTLMVRIEQMRLKNEIGITQALMKKGLLNLPRDTFDPSNRLALTFPKENLVDLDEEILEDDKEEKKIEEKKVIKDLDVLP